MRAHLSCAVGRRAFFGLLAAGSLAPQTRPAIAISATTMTGKTRPDLGIILADAARAEGGTVTAELVVSGGLVASVAFDSKWKLAEGGYYDVEANTREGDAAYLQRVPLPAGKDLASLPAKFFTAAVLGVDGRYGAYGAPVDGKVIADVSDNGKRLVDISFTSLSPGSAELPRRAVVTAIQPSGSTDLILLVAGASASRWKKGSGEADARAAARSLRLVSARPSSLQAVAQSDYRYGKTTGPEKMKSRNDGPQYSRYEQAGGGDED